MRTFSAAYRAVGLAVLRYQVVLATALFILAASGLGHPFPEVSAAETQSTDVGPVSWWVMPTTPNPLAPAERDGHAMTYDPARARVVLFGGTESTGKVFD